MYIHSYTHTYTHIYIVHAHRCRRNNKRNQTFIRAYTTLSHSERVHPTPLFVMSLALVVLRKHPLSFSGGLAQGVTCEPTGRRDGIRTAKNGIHCTKSPAPGLASPSLLRNYSQDIAERILSKKRRKQSSQ